VRAYNSRAREMDSALMRLALFLDPRYKKAANAEGKLRDLLRLVRLDHEVFACSRVLLHASSCICSQQKQRG